MYVSRSKQDGREKEIVCRTSVNPQHVVFGGQNNLQHSRIIDAAAFIYEQGALFCATCSQTLLRQQHEKKQLEWSEVLEKQHTAPAGILLLGRHSHPLTDHSTKRSLSAIHCSIPFFFPTVGSPALMPAFRLPKSICFLNLVWSHVLQQKGKFLTWFNSWASFCSVYSREGARESYSRGCYSIASTWYLLFPYQVSSNFSEAIIYFFPVVEMNTLQYTKPRKHPAI